MHRDRINEVIEFSEEQQIQMQKELESQKGLSFIIPIKTDVKKVGNGLGFTIAKSIMNYLGFQLGDTVYLYIRHREENE